MSIINTKLVLIIGVILISTHLTFAQNTPVYFKFDTISKKTFLKEDGSGNKTEELLYKTHEINNGDIIFYIKDIMFVHDKQNMTKKTLIHKNTYDSITLLCPDDVQKYIKVLQKKYPFGPKYPSKKYPEIFIANLNEDKGITLYQVKWQYYVE